jgi:hypothetical protein
VTPDASLLLVAGAFALLLAWAPGRSPACAASTTGWRAPGRCSTTGCCTAPRSSPTWPPATPSRWARTGRSASRRPRTTPATR